MGALALLLAVGFWGYGASSPGTPSTASPPSLQAPGADTSGHPAGPANGEPGPGPARANALEGSASEKDGTLRVEVLSAGVPRRGARVTLYRREPPHPTPEQTPWRLAGSGLTDDAGIAVLPARAGSYLVSARAEGFAPARAEVTRPTGEARTTVRLMLDAGVSLTGTTVERLSRDPVPLVELTLVPRLSTTAWASAPEEERTRAASDARGAFQFQGVSPGDYQLEARAPGHAPKRLTRVHVPSSGVIVELEGSAFVEGFVELPEGQPAVGAEVRAFGADDTLAAETGAGGGFSLDVPPGSYQLVARLGALTGTARDRAFVAAGKTLSGLRIRLGPAASLGGLVRAKDSGQPVPGAVLVLGPNAERGEISQALSAADGRFEMNGLAPGAYDLTVQARGFKPRSFPGLTVLAGQRFEVLADLEANGRIEGSVVDGEQRPLAGIQVTPQKRWGPVPGALTAVTDATGHFLLEDLPPGDLYVAARRPDSEVNTREHVKVEPGRTAQVKLQLSEEGTLEGTVRGAGGGALPGPVTVFILRIGASRSEGRAVPASVQGTWSVRMGAGRYQLSAWQEDSPPGEDQSKAVELKAGETQRVELEVRPAKKPLRVTVLEPNGAASVRATVMASEAGHSDILAEQMTDESGQTTVVADGLGSNALHLWATNGGRRGDLLAVPTSRSAVTLPLEPGARLTGSVRAAGGGAIKGFHLTVTAVRTGEEDYLTRKELEFTGDQFVVEDVIATRVSVSATLPDGRAGKAELTTRAGETSRVDLVVEAGSRIMGRLLDAKTGEPLSQAYVDVEGLYSPTTGPDGRFQVDDIAPGAHRVTAWGRGHALVEKQVTVVSGKKLDLGDWRLGPTRVEPGRLGLSFGMSGNDVIINGLTEGAETGDVRVGDGVVAIDGARVLTPGEARQRELGAPGSPVPLTLLREGRTLSLTLTRAR